MERTPQDFQAAIESMSRIRAVESPPDDKGERTIWHRAMNGVELISWVQADGTLSSQTLNAWGSSVLWKRGVGLSTAEIAQEQGKPEVVVTHAQADKALIQRLTVALAPYEGTDQFISHFKQILQLGDSADFVRRVTREAVAFAPPPKFVSVMPLEAAKPVPPASNAMLIIGALIGVAVLAALWLMFGR